MTKARELSPPDSLAWVKGDLWKALANCYEQLHDLEDGANAVVALDVPILLYNGVEDSCHDPMRAFATEYGLNFLSLPGDHMSAMRDGRLHLAPMLKTF